MSLYNNHFCSIWKSNGNSFNQRKEELKLNFEVIDNVVSDKHVESSVKLEYDRYKIQSLLTNIMVNGLEIYS